MAGRVADHWVTARAGFQPWNRPMGSSSSSAIRVTWPRMAPGTKSVRADTDETWWHTLTEDQFPPSVWDGTGILNAVRDLVAAIETGAETRSTGEDGRAAIEVIMALYESERRGHEKIPLPLEEPRRRLEVLRAGGLY